MESLETRDLSPMPRRSFGAPPPTTRLRPPSPVSVVLRRLEKVGTLSDVERGLIERLSIYRETVPAGRSLGRAGGPVGPRILLSGWACRQRTLPDGRRQIFTLLIPGDTVGLGADSALEDVSTVALTRVECVDALVLKEILSAHDERHARLNRALAAARRQEESCLLDHIVRLGRQSAMERVAHFFLEMRDRLRLAGLCENDRMPFPLTQEVIADALGLSIVHLNRTLQLMKRDRLITLKSGLLSLLDTRQLEALADYGCHDA